MSDFSGLAAEGGGAIVPPAATGVEACAPMGYKITAGDMADEGRSGLEPELGGIWRDAPQRSGFEPELGGVLRQKGVYVDELTCIGCKHCAHVARNTFYIEPDYGRSRVVRQDGDSEELVQEAIDTCPVDCIHWVDYTELKSLEAERQYQVIPPVVGFPVDRALVTTKRRQKKKGPVDRG